MTDYPIHPACALWPRPSDEEVLAIADDIKANGLLNPIWLFEGAILDGKTRYEACGVAGVEPRFETYIGKDPVGFTVSQNKSRRHMTSEELAFAVAELSKLSHGGNRSNLRDRSLKDASVEKLAKIAGIGMTSVYEAKSLLKNGEPNIIELARSGKVGIASAAVFVRRTSREKQRTAVVDDIKGQTGKKNPSDTIRRNKYGVPVQGKRNIPVTIPSKKTLEERKKPQPMLTIPARDVAEKFRSLIKRVKEQSNKHPATVSFGALRVIAFELEQLADSWTENGLENGTHSEPVPFNSVHKGG